MNKQTNTTSISPKSYLTSIQKSLLLLPQTELQVLEIIFQNPPSLLVLSVLNTEFSQCFSNQVFSMLNIVCIFNYTPYNFVPTRSFPLNLLGLDVSILISSFPAALQTVPSCGFSTSLYYLCTSQIPSLVILQSTFSKIIGTFLKLCHFKLCLQENKSKGSILRRERKKYTQFLNKETKHILNLLTVCAGQIFGTMTSQCLLTSCSIKRGSKPTFRMIVQMTPLYPSQTTNCYNRGKDTLITFYQCSRGSGSLIILRN